MFFLKSSIISAIVCLFSLFVTEAEAHYMWLNLNDYTPKENQAAKFTVGWGHSFYNPVEDILYGQELIDTIYIVDQDAHKIEVKALNEFQYESQKQLSQGSYIAMVQRKEGFSTKTTEGYKQQSKKGLKNTLHSRYIGMYGKAIINVGDQTQTQTIMRPVGVALEIVPLTNPSEVKAGDYFRFKLLYQGKPIAEYINATYVGFSTENAWAYSTRTDNRGVGDIKILTAGIWVIKANLKAPYPDSEEADEYSYTTSLTFEVR